MKFFHLFLDVISHFVWGVLWCNLDLLRFSWSYFIHFSCFLGSESPYLPTPPSLRPGAEIADPDEELIDATPDRIEEAQTACENLQNQLDVLQLSSTSSGLPEREIVGSEVEEGNACCTVQYCFGFFFFFFFFFSCFFFLNKKKIFFSVFFFFFFFFFFFSGAKSCVNM